MRNTLFVTAIILLSVVLACDVQVFHLELHNLTHLRYLRVSVEPNDLSLLAWAFLAAFQVLPLFAVWAARETA